MSFQPFDLYMAILLGDYDTIKRVVESGVELNFRIQNQTPLFLAIVNDAREETIEVLVSHGADVNATSTNCETSDEPPIVAASRKIYNYAVRILLRVPELNINLCNSEGKGALYFASQQNDPEKVSLLLQHGANVYIGTSAENCPFFSSVRCSEEQIEIIRLLLQYGFNRDRYTNCSNGRSIHILHFAIQARKQKTLELLLQAGFRGNPIENQSFLHLCAIWDEETGNRTRDIISSPLNLKTSASNAIRKIIIDSYGNLKQCYLDQLPIPEAIRNELLLIK